MAHEKAANNIPEFGGTGKSQNGESMGGWQKRGVRLTASATTRRFARGFNMILYFPITA
ncbi:MAG: hypothetical protein ACLQU6_07435 [Limisphaerales bacterium]